MDPGTECGRCYQLYAMGSRGAGAEHGVDTVYHLLVTASHGPAAETFRDPRNWIVERARTHPTTRCFHVIWIGKRDGSFKVQRLGDLHCTTNLAPNGLVAVQMGCPRVEAALGR